MGKFREAEIFLFESTFDNHRHQLDSVRNENILLKEFKLKHAWGKIFVKMEKK